MDDQEDPSIVDDIIETIKSLVINGYDFLLLNQLRFDDIAPVAGQHLKELADIASKKNVVIKNQHYDTAAWLRDREKTIIGNILSEKFGKKYFMLLDEAEKKIIFRYSNRDIDRLVPDNRKRF